jgi:hypothetical protein
MRVSLSRVSSQGMLMLVKHLKKEELEGLRKLFIEMDADKSGAPPLPPVRLAVCLRALLWLSTTLRPC